MLRAGRSGTHHHPSHVFAQALLAKSNAKNGASPRYCQASATRRAGPSGRGRMTRVSGERTVPPLGVADVANASATGRVSQRWLT